MSSRDAFDSEDEDYDDSDNGAAFGGAWFEGGDDDDETASKPYSSYTRRSARAAPESFASVSRTEDTRSESPIDMDYSTPRRPTPKKESNFPKVRVSQNINRTRQSPRR